MPKRSQHDLKRAFKGSILLQIHTTDDIHRSLRPLCLYARFTLLLGEDRVGDEAEGADRHEGADVDSVQDAGASNDHASLDHGLDGIHVVGDQRATSVEGEENLQLRWPKDTVVLTNGQVDSLLELGGMGRG